jgi:diguanylate cyclase (GGDEF)-like protein
MLLNFPAGGCAVAIAKLSTAPVVGLYPPLAVTRAPGRDRRQDERSPADGDDTSFMGLSEEELTPGVRKALGALLDEVEALRGDLQRTRGRVQELGRLADEDSLLPMVNRRAFLRELSRMSAFARRYRWSLCLLFFDVDGLKRINDSYGHAAGDACLRHIADLLVANVRGSDLVGRLGGDEIGVIMNRCDLPTAKDKAQSLVAQVGTNPLVWQGQAVPLSLSVGVCSFAGAEPASDMLAAADEAMYRAKKGSGRAA